MTPLFLQTRGVLKKELLGHLRSKPRRGPAAAARSERCLAGRVAASTGASPQVRGRRPLVRALPRPSVNVGVSIESVFGRSAMRTKPSLKGRYSLAETCLVTSSRYRRSRCYRIGRTDHRRGAHPVPGQGTLAAYAHN